MSCNYYLVVTRGLEKYQESIGVVVLTSGHIKTAADMKTVYESLSKYLTWGSRAESYSIPMIASVALLYEERSAMQFRVESVEQCFSDVGISPLERPVAKRPKP